MIIFFSQIYCSFLSRQQNLHHHSPWESGIQGFRKADSGAGGGAVFTNAAAAEEGDEKEQEKTLPAFTVGESGHNSHYVKREYICKEYRAAQFLQELKDMVTEIVTTVRRDTSNRRCTF